MKNQAAHSRRHICNQHCAILMLLLINVFHSLFTILTQIRFDNVLNYFLILYTYIINFIVITGVT